MNYHVEISEEAKGDMHDIFQYIAFTLLQLNTAAKQIERIEKGIYDLDFMPRKHKSYPFLKRTDLHMFMVDNYSILYTINDETQEVTVARVLYGRRNIPKILE